MKQLLEIIPTDLYPVIADYAKILIPSVITYLITRYSLSKPRRYAIKEKQFEYVYLPLYLLTQQYFSALNSNNRQDITVYTRKVDKIIYKYFPYIYPKTVKLFSKYKNQPSYSNFFALQNQISFDYERLKRELGYPSSSFIEIFRRLTGVDKALYFVYLLFATGDIYAIVSSFDLLIKGDLINAFSALAVAGILSLFLYLFGYMKVH